ncbi:Golgi apyrase [Pseudogymnoascus australis]
MGKRMAGRSTVLRSPEMLIVRRRPMGDYAKEKASPKDLKSLPHLKTHKKWKKKIHPGISTFGERPTDVGEDHLKELLDHALDIVPADQVAETPIFLMATAGMRLLPPIQQAAILREVCAYARANTKFALPDCDLHIQIIPGETEGLYGWIAANYLVGGFDTPEDHAHGKNHHTYGFLDMGGASAQIAFAPNSTEAQKHSDDLKLLRMRTLDGVVSEYKVFVASWLGFGVNQARQRYVSALVDSVDSSTSLEIPDPCIVSGLTLSVDGTILDPDAARHSSEPYLTGQGSFAECLKKTYPLLEKDAACIDEPCLINGQHVPAIDFDVNHFIGVSQYWHTTHEFFKLSHDDETYDFTKFQSRVQEFCNLDWKEIERGVDNKKWGKKVDEKAAMELCFKASWLTSILHEGIGIPRLGVDGIPKGVNGTNEALRNTKEGGYLDPFQAVDKIDGTEVSWTLGKMVLYAAGQIEPQGKDLPVGFGANVPSGISDDFQRAGSTYSPWNGGDDDDDWDDKILDKASKSSTGLFIMVFIVGFLLYIFRKKERRSRAYSKISSAIRRSRTKKGGRSFFNTSKLFGRRSGYYERVLEEGDGVNDFELADVDSDDSNDASDGSEGSSGARASGLATPKLNVVSYGDGNFFSPVGTHGFHADGSHHTLTSNHLQPNAMDRSGLVVRTESRERLAPSLTSVGSGRSRSRAGSPTRKSPLMSPVDED